MKTTIVVAFMDGTKYKWEALRWKIVQEDNIIWLTTAEGAKVTINLANVKWWSREEQE